MCPARPQSQKTRLLTTLLRRHHTQRTTPPQDATETIHGKAACHRPQQEHMTTMNAIRQCGVVTTNSRRRQQLNGIGHERHRAQTDSGAQKQRGHISEVGTTSLGVHCPLAIRGVKGHNNDAQHDDVQASNGTSSNPLHCNQDPRSGQCRNSAT